MNKPTSVSAHIDQKIEQLADWRGQTLAAVRAVLLSADPEACRFNSSSSCRFQSQSY